MTFNVPAKVRLAVTATRSLTPPPTVPAGPSSKLDTDPEFNTSEPTVRVPTALLPGERIPPLKIVTAPLMVPVPPNVAPVSTCTAEFAQECREPITGRLAHRSARYRCWCSGKNQGPGAALGEPKGSGAILQRAAKDGRRVIPAHAQRRPGAQIGYCAGAGQ